jgi:hypothetical protein
VRETYPVELAKQEFTPLEVNNLKNILKSGKDSDPLRKLLLPHFEYGPNLLEHLCLERGIALNTKLKAGDSGNPDPGYSNRIFSFFLDTTYISIFLCTGGAYYYVPYYVLYMGLLISEVF